MATTEETRSSGATHAPIQEYDVVLRLQTPKPPSQEALEELSIEALEAVERDAGEVVLGIAAACEFNPPAIVLDFSVTAASTIEMHDKLREVLAALVNNLPITIEALSESAVLSGRTDERELVPA